MGCYKSLFHKQKPALRYDRTVNIRQHLERYGFQLVRPTPRLVHYWWRRALTEVFEYPQLRSLIPVTVEIRKQDGEWAACHWPDPEGVRLHLTFHNEVTSRNGFLTVLLHEMVHAIMAHEHTYGKTEKHCERFLSYASIIKKKTGLPLQDRYSHEEIQALGRKLRSTK